MTYGRFDVILVSFPFTDKRGQKQRPAVVLTSRTFLESHHHAVAAMVTTASNTVWPSDMQIAAFVEAGLHGPSVIRMKLFTVADALIIGRVGTLAQPDQLAVTKAVQHLFFE